MDYKTIFTILVFVIFVATWYAHNSKRDKIYCTLRRANKTSVSKFVKMSDRYVVMDGYKFNVVRSCIVFEYWNKGLLHMLFPQWIAKLDYTVESIDPFDPNTLKPTIISPAVRKVMNKEEWAKSYFKTSQPTSNKKQGFIMQWLPLISIIAVVLVGFYLYSNQTAMGQHLLDIQRTIDAIAK